MNVNTSILIEGIYKSITFNYWTVLAKCPCDMTYYDKVILDKTQDVGLRRGILLNMKIVEDKIRQAFFDLLNKKSYSSITVKEIVTKAGCSKSSFYNSYSSKEDIVVKHFEEAYEELRNMREGRGLQEYLKYYFEYVKADKKRWKLLIAQGLCDAEVLNMKHSMELFEEQYALSHEDAVKQLALESMLFGLVCTWVLGDCEMPIDEIVLNSCIYLEDDSQAVKIG